MWEKIKNILAVIGGVLLAGCAFLVGFFCHSDRQRVSDTDDKLDSATDRLTRDEDRLESDEDRIRECKEVLERAKKRAEKGTD